MLFPPLLFCREYWYSNVAFDSFLDEMPTNPLEAPTWVCGECQGAMMSLWETHCTKCGHPKNFYAISSTARARAPSERLKNSVPWDSASESLVPWVPALEPSIWVPPETSVPSVTPFDQSSVSTIPEIKESLEFSRVRIPQKRKAGYGDVESLLEIQASATNQDDDCDTSNSVEATIAAPQLVYWFVNDLFGRLTSKGLIWDAQTIENASSLLPSLLEAFATKIGCEDDTPMQLEAVAFFQIYNL